MDNGFELLEAYLVEHAAEASSDARLRDIAYRRLFDALRNLTLDPGTALPETRLSAVLGISRTPVREALQQLASEGIIQLINGRAVTIAPRSAQELFDALRVRELLEPEVVRLAATNLAANELARLHQLIELMGSAAREVDRNAWSRFDREWHEVLCNGCPNQLLGQMVLQARNRMYHKGSDEHVLDQYLIDGTEEHRLIVEAIATQDAEEAERLMQVHLREARENMFRRLVRR